MNRWPFGSSFGIKSFLGVFVGVIVALMAPTGPVGRAHEQVVRWDIVNVVAGNVTSGGIASAKATNADGMETSMITFTGSGTFEPPENDEEGDDVTGGGTWMITTGAVTTTGTYKVTGVVRWTEAPGMFPAITDNIGNRADARAGLAVLRIRYSDGDLGVLAVSCSLIGTPNTVFEGVSATKSFSGYWKVQPPRPGVNANRTLFHVMNEKD